jgi:hypothetical protein
LAAIRLRADAATKGPWTVDRELHQRTDWHYVVRTIDKPAAHPWSYRFLAWLNGGLGEGRTPHDDAEVAADAEFIAHAREDVPSLMAEVQRLGSLVGDR